MLRRIKPGVILRHFKRDLTYEDYAATNMYLYQVICRATYADTGEELIIYQALYEPFKVYARPAQDMFSLVDTTKYPRATQMRRFDIVEVKDGHYS